MRLLINFRNKQQTLMLITVKSAGRLFKRIMDNHKTKYDLHPVCIDDLGHVSKSVNVFLQKFLRMST